MAKGSRGRRRIASRQYRSSPYHLTSCNHDVSENMIPRKCFKMSEKKDWEDATCSVCMDHPHNAVLLLCSSHDKGCRPYMCGTSFRYSNCLDQYRKAYTKVASPHHVQSLDSSADSQIVRPMASVCELACPLCRGQVKGCTVVKPAREFLNAKKRSCMQDNCSFFGTYKELRKHVRADHPSARPREVDPALEQQWRHLERERERDDVISTIRSSMPGALVFGDYVIEGNHAGFDTDDEEGDFNTDHAGGNEGFEVGFDSNLVNVFLLMHAFGPAGNVGLSRRLRRPERSYSNSSQDGTGVLVHPASPDGNQGSSNQDEDDSDGGGGVDGVPQVSPHRGRVLLGHSGRRRRLADHDVRR
ncbi:Protein of unknown function DUF1644 [Dillenia turbinata]|uniref:Uncharacterized protein n=1 Tax=Dillenia turbinata TaxID=194707 RepID=A0AAN8ZQ61_9MAGN